MLGSNEQREETTRGLESQIEKLLQQIERLNLDRSQETETLNQEKVHFEVKKIGNIKFNFSRN